MKNGTRPRGAGCRRRSGGGQRGDRQGLRGDAVDEVAGVLGEVVHELLDVLGGVVDVRGDGDGACDGGAGCGEVDQGTDGLVEVEVAIGVGGVESCTELLGEIGALE